MNSCSPTSPNGGSTRLIPICSVRVRRYSEQRVKINKRTEPYKIAAMKREHDRSRLPPDWNVCYHPHGVPYYYNTERRMLTDANISIESTMTLVEDCAKHIDFLLSLQDVEGRIRGSGGKGDRPASELVIEIVKESSEADPAECGYYIVHDDDRSLVWLAGCDVEPMLHAELGAEMSLPRIELALEACYWKHWEMFPCHRDVSTTLWQELKGVTGKIGINSVLGDESAVADFGGSAVGFLMIIGCAQSLDPRGGSPAWLVGRLMRMYVQARCSDDFNQQMKCQEAWPSNLPVWTISVLLFTMPAKRLKTLSNEALVNRKARGVGEKRNYGPWNEWTMTAFMSLILLLINVRLLNVPSVDIGPNFSSVAKLATCISCLTSMGSAMSGLIVGRREPLLTVKGPLTETPWVPIENVPIKGLQSLAILYSLPSALLVWAIISFLVSLATIFLRWDYVMFDAHLAIRLSLGVAWGLVVGLLVWAAAMFSRL